MVKFIWEATNSNQHGQYPIYFKGARSDDDGQSKEEKVEEVDGFIFSTLKYNNCYEYNDTYVYVIISSP